MKRMTATLTAILLAGTLGSPTNASAQAPSKPDTSGWKTIAIALTDANPQIGEYWVGMEVTQPSDDERKKLELPADRGILVRQVVPDSPAAKAGFKVGDALLMAGDKPLKELTDALEAIRQAKDSDLTFEFVRNGKTDKATIKPAKRPSGFGFEEAVKPQSTAAKSANAEKELARARERLQFALTANPDLRKIRAELHEIQERIGAIDRQLAQLEASRPNPNRERISRQMTALKRAIAELMDAGRTEDAERLQRELRELGQQLESSGERGADASTPGTLHLAVPSLPGVSLEGREVQRIAILEGGEKAAPQPGALPPPVEPRRVLTYQLAAPQQSDATVADLRKQVEQLRRELSELRDQAAKAKKP